MAENPLWYKDAVFYEVYVRAYHDSNCDGHGVHLAAADLSLTA
jgi:maltose alpha-D-glucosyltransferase/alpha-amylase